MGSGEGRNEGEMVVPLSPTANLKRGVAVIAFEMEHCEWHSRIANAIHTGPIPQGRIGRPNGIWAYAQCFTCRMVLPWDWAGLLENRRLGVLFALETLPKRSTCRFKLHSEMRHCEGIVMWGLDESSFEPANSAPCRQNLTFSTSFLCYATKKGIMQD